jgi:peptidoglycan/LPS O-acetylase OafA/YrhL
MAGMPSNVNGVLWSVQVELVMIPVLPVLMYVGARLSNAANLAVCALLAVASLLLWGKLPLWLNAVLYLYCFHAGIILPQLLRDGTARRVLSNAALTIGGLVALLVLDYLYSSNRLWMPYKFVADAAISAQLLGFIMCRPAAGAVRWLGARPLVWLGDVSYSFYVYSLSLQLLVSGFLLRFLDAPPSNGPATALTLVVIFGTIAAALPLAAISHRWIELPGIAQGQVWSRRVAGVSIAAVLDRIVAAAKAKTAKWEIP